MKKVLALVLALILVSVLPAFAEEETPQREKDLFDLWDYEGESMRWLGFGTPIGDGLLLASPAGLPETPDHLAVSDGTSVWEVKAILPDSTGALALVCYDPEKTQPRYDSWTLMPYGAAVSADACYIRSGDDLGSRINHRVLSAQPLTWKGRACFLLAVEDEVPPGSPVLTSDGELAGIVVADYAEGSRLVLAVSSLSIAESLTEASSLLSNLPAWSDPPEGLQVTLDRNLATIDWTGMTLPEKAEGETLYMVIVDTGNDYLNYYAAESEERTAVMLLTPGRFYLAGIVASKGTPDSTPEQFVTFSVPAARRLTEYHFRSVVCAIAESPEGGLKNDEAPVPVTEVTEELLRSDRAWFFSTSTYEVTEQISDRTLLVTLTDPNGVNYRYESYWLYAPEYMEEDTWYLNLREQGLTSSLDRNGYPRGVYEMAFYVDGELADSFTFELK